MARKKRSSSKKGNGYRTYYMKPQKTKNGTHQEFSVPCDNIRTLRSKRNPGIFYADITPGFKRVKAKVDCEKTCEDIVRENFGNVQPREVKHPMSIVQAGMYTTMPQYYRVINGKGNE